MVDQLLWILSRAAPYVIVGLAAFALFRFVRHRIGPARHGRAVAWLAVLVLLCLISGGLFTVWAVTEGATALEALEVMAVFGGVPFAVGLIPIGVMYLLSPAGGPPRG
ncbi:MAG: hypothetical protein HYX69_10845 [Planctomycetia bacterium]|nr:hypothetical protein [Planctomycetia bacterium]